MRFPSSALLLPIFLFTSCANEGVVVRKDSNALPFYHSLGVDASYKLALRDNAGAVRSQLVTAEVFEGYAKGDYFNDLQPPLTQGPTSTNVKETTPVTPTPAQTLAAGRFRNGNRIAANAGGVGRSTSLVKAPQSSITHSVTSAQNSPRPAPLAPKVQSPVVSAHFAVAVQNPAPVYPVASNPGYSPAVHAIVAKVQPLSQAPPQKSPVAASVQKASTDHVLPVQTSRRSYHVASNAPKIASGATPVSSTLRESSLPSLVSSPPRLIPPNHVGVTTALVSRSPKTPAPALATSKTGTSKKGAKRSALPTARKRSAGSSQRAHAVISEQTEKGR